MKRVAIFGKKKVSITEIKNCILKNGFLYVKKNPDFVISYGGDGTYLLSEQKYPCIPKILVRNSKICMKCHEHPLDHILDRINKNQYSIQNNIKLGAFFNKKVLFATNEVIIRNKLQTSAIRFNIFVNDKKISEELIGDGIVISTPFGSTGYFYSIARKSFEKGIGITFNNITKKLNTIISSENVIVKIEMTRGDAILSVDNNPKMYVLRTGKKIIIKKIKHVARIIKIF